jgi:hypothetical protein
MRRLLLQSGAAGRVCYELLLNFILALIGNRPSLNWLRTSRELRLLHWALTVVLKEADPKAGSRDGRTNPARPARSPRLLPA